MGLTSITFTVKNAAEAMSYNDQVTAQGLSVNGDYAWRFVPAVIEFYGEVAEPASAEFSFQDPKWATYFQLKWGK